MKRFIKKKNIKVLKIIDDNNLGSIFRTFLSGIIIISFFYSFPLIINFTNSKILNSQEYQNKSKALLAYTLNKKNNNLNENDETYNERDLLIDIFSLNDLETDTVRLDASTIKQLFEDTGYKLEDVRKKKLVKPVALTLLPQEIKMIENTKKRKEFFIQIVLPLILKENNNIRLDRKRLFSIINKNKNTDLEKKRIEKK